MHMIRNAILLSGFVVLIVAQRFLPAEEHAKAPAIPRIESANPVDVTQWPTKVYASFALPKVKWALDELKISAEPLPIDPVFFVDSAANDQTSSDVAGMLKPISETRPLICSGSGSFHHLSYAICHEWIDKMQIPYTVIMFDAHDDAAKPRTSDGDTIHCGMWGHYAMATSPYLKRFIGIGVDNNLVGDQYQWLSDQAYIEGKMDIYPTRTDRFFFGHAFNRSAVDFKRIQKDLAWMLVGAEGYHCTIRPFNEAGFDLLSRIPTEHVFFSVDMDVIHPFDFAAVEWDNGNMQVREILRVIDLIAANRTVLGADICGYPQYQNEIELSADEEQLNLKAYRRIYDRLAKHLSVTESAP